MRLCKFLIIISVRSSLVSILLRLSLIPSGAVLLIIWFGVSVFLHSSNIMRNCFLFPTRGVKHIRRVERNCSIAFFDVDN